MKRAFISFDFDNDDDLRHLLVGQAKSPDTPFFIENWSVERAFAKNWEEKVRDRIRKTDLTIVICGDHTNRADGVAIELEITREENKPYFLLSGRANKLGTKPATALSSDKIYKWTWENLKRLVAGER